MSAAHSRLADDPNSLILQTLRKSCLSSWARKLWAEEAGGWKRLCGSKGYGQEVKESRHGERSGWVGTGRMVAVTGRGWA